MQQLGALAPARTNTLIAKESRRRALQAALGAVLDEDELERVWELIQKHAALDGSESSDGEDGRVSYAGFLQVQAECAELFGAERTATLLRASTFCSLPLDGRGMVSARALFELTMRKATWQQMSTHVRYHDGTGDGCLREHELQSYLGDVAPTLAGLQAMPDSFAPQWRKIAARRFMFFLDARRRGCVRIRDVLSCPYIGELLALQEPASVSRNWFALRTTLAMYKHFLELDTDRDGALSQAEFAPYGGFTPLFVARLFEVHVQSRHSSRGRMDFEAFLDFECAWRDRQHPLALAYFFRVLDVSDKRCLTALELRLFSQQVQAMRVECGHYAIPVADVVDEIFDLAGFDVHGSIMLPMLATCGQGALIVGLLASAAEFEAYDRREMVELADGAPPAVVDNAVDDEARPVAAPAAARDDGGK